jgi:hypothetical protein
MVRQSSTSIFPSRGHPFFQEAHLEKNIVFFIDRTLSETLSRRGPYLGAMSDLTHNLAGVYSDPRPDSKIGRLRVALMHLLDEHRRDGALPTSVRFLFYELVARSIISKEGDRPDKIVSEGSPTCASADMYRGTTSSMRPARLRISVARRR